MSLARPFVVFVTVSCNDLTEALILSEFNCNDETLSFKVLVSDSKIVISFSISSTAGEYPVFLLPFSSFIFQKLTDTLVVPSE